MTALTEDLALAIIFQGKKGTAMPAWGKESGGPLTRTQAKNVAGMLIHWDSSTERLIHELEAEAAKAAEHK